MIKEERHTLSSITRNVGGDDDDAMGTIFYFIFLSFLFNKK